MNSSDFQMTLVSSVCAYSVTVSAWLASQGQIEQAVWTCLVAVALLDSWKR